MSVQDKNIPKFEMSRAELEELGRGRIAYVRPIGSSEARTLMGADIMVKDGDILFCLYMADGTPLAISSTPEAAIANAMVNDLQPMRLN